MTDENKCNVPDGSTLPVIECRSLGVSYSTQKMQQALDGLISKHKNPDPDSLFIYMTKETYALACLNDMSYRGYKFRLLNNGILDKGVIYLSNQLEI